MTRAVSVVGTRPQLIKVAALQHLVGETFEHTVIHTGQHYDPMLSAALIEEFGLDTSLVNLQTPPGGTISQISEMLLRLEAKVSSLKPDIVIHYGDTNSTLVGAIVANKMRIPSAHVEAGLRSRNRQMQEENNRVVTDHLSDLCLAPDADALGNLEREGLLDRSCVVGDVMIDLLDRTSRDVLAVPPAMPESFPSTGNYVFATFHRQELLQDLNRLSSLFSVLSNIDVPVVIPAHPSLRVALSSLSTVPEGNIVFTEPLGYRQTVNAVLGALAVLTDSGGLQKESSFLRVPTATIREQTEWTTTLASGWNRLIWQDFTEILEFIAAPRLGLDEKENFVPDVPRKIVDALVTLVEA